MVNLNIYTFLCGADYWPLPIKNKGIIKDRNKDSRQQQKQRNIRKKMY